VILISAHIHVLIETDKKVEHCDALLLLVRCEKEEGTHVE
jgi:hypothetical protein